MKSGIMGRRGPRKEGGWALLTILFFVAALTISLASVAPRPAFETQRDLEDELIFRGKQYTHAIQLYFRKFRRYPVKIEDLENTNQIRFLRKRWHDPFTGSDEWRLLHIGPAGVVTDSVLQTPGNIPGAPGAGMGPSTGLGSPASGFGQPAPGTPGAVTGGITGTATGVGQPAVGQPGLGQPSTGFGASTSGTSFGLPQSLSPTTALPTTVPGTVPGLTTPGGFSGGGQVFGVAIAGVASKSDRASIKTYNRRQKYSEWEFIYDYRRDPMLQGQQGTGVPGQPGVPVQPPGGLGQPGGFGQPGQPGGIIQPRPQPVPPRP